MICAQVHALMGGDQSSINKDSAIVSVGGGINTIIKINSAYWSGICSI